MDHDLKSRLVYESKILKHQRDTIDKRLDSLDLYRSMHLRRNKRSDGRVYYYVRGQGSATFRYVGKGDNKTVLRVKEAKHLESSLSVIDNDLQLINSLLDGYMPFELSSIGKSLPETYQLDTPLVLPSYKEAGSKWKAEKLAYQATFPENHPEKKTERTSDHIMVKSKSEALVYDRMLDAGLIPIYELPLVCNDYGPPLYPDFTVLSPIDLKTEIIIEYIGRLDMQSYREDFAYRLFRLMKNGYVPGVNLFLVFSDIDGHLDSLQVNKVIADILCLR